MGWRFKWVSSFGSDFNLTTTCRFLLTKSAPRASTTTQRRRSKRRVARREHLLQGPDGAVFHTYSAYARGLDILIGAYNWLDLTPKGRDEADLPWAMAWVRRHDEYGEDAAAAVLRIASQL